MPSAPGFRDKYGPSALVTGGSEGLGAAFAREIASRGVDLVLAARRAGPLESIANELRAAHGVKVTQVIADAGTTEGLKAIGEIAEANETGLFVHSAAVSTIGEVTDLPEETHEAMVALNCRAPVMLSHRLGRAMAARGRGGIVFLSSLAGLTGTAMVAHYAATKAYQRVLAEGLWAELQPRGVDVLACLAGPTETPTYRSGKPRGEAFIEWPPVMDPAVVARETLAALGRGPVVVPGLGNKAADVLVRRVLPRSVAVRMMSDSTRKMYKSS